jgi:hypothetical protein
MKLLVVTSLAEHADKVAELLTRSGVTVFSRTETIGFKETYRPNMLDSWYANSNGKYNSLFFFSFTTAESAQKVLQAIDECNREKRSHFPLRGFILPVEASTLVE